MVTEAMKGGRQAHANGLLLDGRKVFREATDAAGRERAFSLVLQAVSGGAADGHALLAYLYQTVWGPRRKMGNAARHYAMAAIYGDATAERRWRWLMALEGFLWHRGDAFSG